MQNNHINKCWKIFTHQVPLLSKKWIRKRYWWHSSIMRLTVHWICGRWRDITYKWTIGRYWRIITEISLFSFLFMLLLYPKNLQLKTYMYNTELSQIAVIHCYFLKVDSVRFHCPENENFLVIVLLKCHFLAE